MTAEKYVNTITKRIKCSRTKRKEIRQQLLSDISAAQEAGEPLDAIIKRLGSAKDMAKEFNENIAEPEYKKYRKGRFIKISLLLVFILAVLVAGIYWILPKGAEVGSGGVFEKTAVEESIKDVIEKFNDNDYEALQMEAIEELKPALNEEQMQDAKNQLSEDWGSCQSVGKIYMSELKQLGRQYVVGEVTVTYEHVSVTFRLTFDEDMKLAGLYMR